jgi:hypothetical protein
MEKLVACDHGGDRRGRRRAPHFRKGLTQRLSDRHPTHMTVPFFSYKIVMALRSRHRCHMLRVSW